MDYLILDDAYYEFRTFSWNKDQEEYIKSHQWLTTKNNAMFKCKICGINLHKMFSEHFVSYQEKYNNLKCNELLLKGILE